VADVRPFRAVRYARPSAEVTAPPYDVIDAEQCDALRARDPHNIVHLTSETDERAAAERLRSWLADGTLVREATPAVWLLQQDYVGLDGVERRRDGIVASLRVEPYSTRSILPHERTHADALEGRLRLVRATRTQLEPIFLLYEGPPPVSQPEGDPELEVEGAKLWRTPETDAIVDAFRDRQLMIADGHHRYETTVEYAARGGSPWLMVVLVSTSDPGLTIFPTHRTASHFNPAESLKANGSDPRAALESLPADRPAAVVYTRAGVAVAEGPPGQLDTQLVETLVPGQVGYTAYVDEAIAAVDEGRAEAAFLLRPTRIEDVFAVAKRGEVLPQKTTYFYPKLVSGLLFHPL